MSENGTVGYFWWISAEFAKMLADPVATIEPITGATILRRSDEAYGWTSGRFELSDDKPVSRQEIFKYATEELLRPYDGRFTMQHMKILGFGCDRDKI